MAACSVVMRLREQHCADKRQPETRRQSSGVSLTVYTEQAPTTTDGVHHSVHRLLPRRTPSLRTPFGTVWPNHSVHRLVQLGQTDRTPTVPLPTALHLPYTDRQLYTPYVNGGLRWFTPFGTFLTVWPNRTYRHGPWRPEPLRTRCRTPLWTGTLFIKQCKPRSRHGPWSPNTAYMPDTDRCWTALYILDSWTPFELNRVVQTV